MEKTLYFVEVGVLTPPDYELESYKIKGFHEEFGFYDENKLTFLTQEEAKNYGLSYIEMGVENTYAILYNYICDVEDCDMEEITNWHYCEFSLDMPTETITDFFYKKNGEIIRG